MNEKDVKNFFSYSKFITDILFEILSNLYSRLRHLKKSIVAESLDFTWILPLLMS